MTSVLLLRRSPARLAYWTNLWFDAAQNRALWVFLALFVAIWTSFQIVSYASIDLHPDLIEVFNWSQSLAPGYKHPPLAAVIAAAWFSVFPITDWSFHLLAMVNAAVAFYAIDLIARRYLDGDKRLLVLLLLLLTPFYQFHGQRFSTNQVLLSMWPIATYCFLRSFESRTWFWAAAAGATAALAMLGKYYSILLVAGFVVAALVHPKRFDYLRSPAPWISALVGFAVLAPHLNWLLTTGGQTFEYAYAVHGNLPTSHLLWKLVSFVIGGIGYVSVLLGAYLLIVRPNRQMLLATLWPSDPDRRMLVVLLLVPFLLPLAVSPISGIEFTPLWSMPGWFLLPIVLLSPREAAVSRTDASYVAVFVLGLSLIVLLASPVVAWARLVQQQGSPGRAHYAAVSQELHRAWQRDVQRPLTIVTGNTEFADAAAFYIPDHPRVWTFGDRRLTPWLTEERLEGEGWAAICPAIDKGCIASMEAASDDAEDVIRFEFSHTPSFLGWHGVPVRFVIIMVAPDV